MVFEDAQRPTEVIESSAGTIPLPPLGGIFSAWAGDAHRMVLGPPLTRPLAIFEPSFDVVLGLVERVLTDLVPVHDAGAYHGALELGSWGFDGEGRFVVRPGFDAPPPEGHPQEADVQAIGQIVRELLGEDLRLRFWLRGTGAVTGRVTFRDARAARQALLAVIGRRGVSEALNAWLAAVGGWLPDTRERGAASPRRGRRGAEPSARPASTPMDEGDARRWVERELARLREAQASGEGAGREADPARIRIGGAESPRAAARFAVSAAAVPTESGAPVLARGLAPAASEPAAPRASIEPARASPRLRQSTAALPVAASSETEDARESAPAGGAVASLAARLRDSEDVAPDALPGFTMSLPPAGIEAPDRALASPPRVTSLHTGGRPFDASPAVAPELPSPPPMIAAPAAVSPMVAPRPASPVAAPAASPLAAPAAAPAASPLAAPVPAPVPPPVAAPVPPSIAAPVSPPSIVPPAAGAHPDAPPALDLSFPSIGSVSTSASLASPVATPVEAALPSAPPLPMPLPPLVVPVTVAAEPDDEPAWEDDPYALEGGSVRLLGADAVSPAGDVAWEGALGVTGNSDRAHEKGEGKWLESGRDIGELTRQLPEGPSRPLRLDDGGGGGNTGWIVVGVMVVLLMALVFAFS